MVTRLLSELLQRSKKSVLLLGPRQVGKSTLLKSLRPELSINLASEAEYLKHLSDPGYLPGLIRGQGPQSVLIDEVQRIPAILNTIQAILDDWKSPPKFYLSGSSARKLKRGNANLLPGRIFQYKLGGLCAAELNYQLDAWKAMRFGSLPGLWVEPDPLLAAKILRDYSGSYLAEEIQSEALTRNLAGFSRFLTFIGAAAGDIIDFTKIARQTGLSRTAVRRFVEILEDTLIAERIENFTETDAETIRHPRLYFFDAGVLNGLLSNFEPSADRVGKCFEQLVYNQIRNSAFARDEPCHIHFFRTRNGLEVDFIVRLRNTVYAIEVKAGPVDRADLRPLNAFQEYYGGGALLFAVSPAESQIRMEGQVQICGLNELIRIMEL